MARSSIVVQTFGSNDALLSLAWNNVDRVPTTGGNVLDNPTGVVLLARNANASARTMRLVSTQKGVTVQKDYSIPGNASFGQFVLDTKDLDLAFWGKHGGADAGKLYIDWPDAAAGTEVQYAAYRRNNS